MSEIEETERVLIQVIKKVKNPETLYVQASGYNSSFNLTKIIEEGRDFSNVSLDKIVAVISSSEETYGFENVSLVKVKISVKKDFVDTFEGVMKSERQRLALSKLNELDIKALELEKIAVLIKLTHHNSKNENFDEAAIDWEP